MKSLLSASALALLVATPVAAQQAAPKAPPADRPAAGAGTTGDVRAQTGAQTRSDVQAAQTEQKPGQIDAEKLIGRNVQNPEGDTVGEVSSVILDQDGKVQAVVVGVGGFLGIGQRDVAIAWNEIQVLDEGRRVVADVSKEELKALPEFKYSESRERGVTLGRDRQAATDRAPREPADTRRQAGADRPPTADMRAPAAQPPAAQAPAAGARQEMRAEAQRDERTVRITGLRSDRIIGQNVVNEAGDSIGKIKELVLDQNGQVKQVVVASGGFLGMGARDVAIDWGDLRVDPAQDRVVVAMSEEQLKSLPRVEFAEDERRQQMGDRDRRAAVDTPREGMRDQPQPTQPAQQQARVETRTEARGDTAAARAPAQPQRELGQMRADELLGQNVVNARGERVGEIEDLVIDDKKVVHAVISVGGFLGIGDKDVVIPFEELRLGENNAILMSEASKEQLKQLPEWRRSDAWRPLDRDRPVMDR